MHCTVLHVKPCARLHHRVAILAKQNGFRVKALRSEGPLFEDKGAGDDCVVLLLNSSGIVQIPARVSARDLRAPIQRILEKYPMPIAQDQGICMAGTFWVAASNGIDLKRRIHFQVQFRHRNFYKIKIPGILSIG